MAQLSLTPPLNYTPVRDGGGAAAEAGPWSKQGQKIGLLACGGKEAVSGSSVVRWAEKKDHAHAVQFVLRGGGRGRIDHSYQNELRLSDGAKMTSNSSACTRPNRVSSFSKDTIFEPRPDGATLP